MQQLLDLQPPPPPPRRSAVCWRPCTCRREKASGGVGEQEEEGGKRVLGFQVPARRKYLLHLCCAELEPPTINRGRCICSMWPRTLNGSSGHAHGMRMEWRTVFHTVAVYFRDENEAQTASVFLLQLKTRPPPCDYYIYNQPRCWTLRFHWLLCTLYRNIFGTFGKPPFRASHNKQISTLARPHADRSHNQRRCKPSCHLTQQTACVTVTAGLPYFASFLPFCEVMCDDVTLLPAGAYASRRVLWRGQRNALGLMCALTLEVTNLAPPPCPPPEVILDRRPRISGGRCPRRRVHVAFANGDQRRSPSLHAGVVAELSCAALATPTQVLRQS